VTASRSFAPEHPLRTDGGQAGREADPVATADLVRRTRALLEPGEIDLSGLIVHTDCDSDDEPRMHQETVAVGDLIAAAAGAGDTYVESGVDDSEFASNQHQGLTIAGDEFVWECQQLLRDGTFDLVFYYEAGHHDAVLEAVRDAGHAVTGVTVE
jgi:hypothetical protein